jgi:hypothetical protein
MDSMTPEERSQFARAVGSVGGKCARRSPHKEETQRHREEGSGGASG